MTMCQCNLFDAMAKYAVLEKSGKLIGSPVSYLRMLDKKTPRLAKKIHAELLKVQASVINQLCKIDLLGALRKDAYDTQDNDPNDIDLTGIDALVGIITDETEPIFKKAYKSGIISLGESVSTNQMDESALSYAQIRGAELVGKKWIDGELVDNPNPVWSITETTRAAINDLVSQSVENGWSPQEFASNIEGSFTFSEIRSEMIARTELAFAHTQGNVTGWKDSGVVAKKQSILGSEHDDDDECDEAASDGPIGLDELFSNGQDAPPYHPRCVCALIPITDDGKEETE